eukprot:TRINITY_DN28433_c0_g1_i2.p1 TRINITY_DN28433_c0_g1~~TRINITY_DN28433_c0_g1_i2.p1  ORF type:complete len:155 (+),score=15.77 TRINITY_DN28433_c0_g1_i2:97-561(+)
MASSSSDSRGHAAGILPELILGLREEGSSVPSTSSTSKCSESESDDNPPRRHGLLVGVSEGFMVAKGPDEGKPRSKASTRSARSTRSTRSARSSSSRVSRQDIEEAEAANVPVNDYVALKRHVLEAAQKRKMEKRKEEAERAAALAALPKIISL